MRFLGWRLLIISIAVFFLDLITLGNSNFISTPFLQLIGQIVGLVAVLSIIFNFIFVVVVFRKIRRRAQEDWEKKNSSERKAIRIKRLAGFLIWIWIFVIFPFISMYWMGILSKILESDQGSLAGTIMFTILAAIGTVIPSIFLSSLNIYLIPLLLLSFYLVFSRNQHKRLDPVIYFLIVIFVVLQIWKFSSITNPESEQKRESIDGGNKLVVTIVDLNNNRVDGVEACVNILEDRSMHKCQVSEMMVK